MSMEMQPEEGIYEVVINDEEQHSIWAAEKAVPPGWRKLGVHGSKESCLAHIKEVWNDIRPFSLRRKMGTAVDTLY